MVRSRPLPMRLNSELSRGLQLPESLAHLGRILGIPHVWTSANLFILKFEDRSQTV